MEKQKFDFEAFQAEVISRLRVGDAVLGKEGILTPLPKTAFLCSRQVPALVVLQCYDWAIKFINSVKQ